MNFKSWICILTGIYALIGISIAKELIHSYNFEEEGLNMLPLNFVEIIFMILAFLTLIISLITVYLIKRKNSLKFTNKQRLHFYIPLVIGSILLFIVTKKGYYHLIATVSLIYYGGFLLNLNRFLKTNLIIFAVAEIILGFTAYFVNNYSLLFLAIGFGVLQISFGVYLAKRRNTDRSHRSDFPNEIF